ncbi:MAG: type III-A CRISPR-associated protein Csm2 [Candidatus Aphodosoma sp.]|nr:type III-A CRISPR-associated protein Csm2 [Candidatus Aphodosoma sp.]
MQDSNYNVIVSQLKRDFKLDWIRKGADQEMIDYADKVGKYTKNNLLTTTKIRNLYGEIKRIQSKNNFKDEKSSIYLLKARFAYAYGREKDVRIKNALEVLLNIFKDSVQCINDNETYNNYCNLMEAIIAFHRYYGGK